MTTPTRRLTTPAAPAPDWTNAACRTERDPEIFFPHEGERGGPTKVAAAKRVCARCPLHTACLNWALETRQDFGVWGGLSETERRRIHRRRQPGFWSGRVSAVATIWNERLDEYKEMAGRGMPLARIADALGTNVQTLNTIQERLDQEKAAGTEAVAA